MKNKSKILIGTIVLLVAIVFFAGFFDGRNDKEEVIEAVQE